MSDAECLQVLATFALLTFGATGAWLGACRFPKIGHACTCKSPESMLSEAIALLRDGLAAAGGAKRVRAALRVLIGGWLAMGITFGVGFLFGENPGR